MNNFKKAVVFSLEDRPQEKEVIISINGNTISSLGDICQLKGKEKTCKTNILVNFIASCFGYGDTLGFDVKQCPSDKHIIYVNTELSRVDFDMKMRKIYDLLKIKEELPNFTAIHCKGLKKQDIVLNIQYQLERLKNVYLLIIDGLVDICMDFNNVKASEDTIQLLTEWTEQYNCALITTLHQNPDGNFKEKSRGNLGTYLQQKAESTLISTKKQYKDKSELFSLITQSVRNGADNEYVNFVYDRDLNHIRSLSDDDKNKQHKKSEDYKQQQLEMFKSIFNGGVQYKTGELIEQIKLVFQVERSTAIKIKDYYMSQNVIEKTNKENSHSKIKLK